MDRKNDAEVPIAKDFEPVPYFSLAWVLASSKRTSAVVDPIFPEVFGLRNVTVSEKSIDNQFANHCGNHWSPSQAHGRIRTAGRGEVVVEERVQRTKHGLHHRG